MEARRYAGPLPYTFDYERATRAIVAVKASRQRWNPEPVAAEIRRANFLDSPGFGAGEALFANAFHVQGVDYRWERGELVRPRPIPTR